MLLIKQNLVQIAPPKKRAGLNEAFIIAMNATPSYVFLAQVPPPTTLKMFFKKSWGSHKTDINFSFHSNWDWVRD
jgi:hypothetical protein